MLQDWNLLIQYAPVQTIVTCICTILMLISIIAFFTFLIIVGITHWQNDTSLIILLFIFAVIMLFFMLSAVFATQAYQLTLRSIL